VLALIEHKAQGKKIAVQPAAEETQEPAPDLMSALKASLEAVRAHDDAGDGAAKRRKPAAKPAARKSSAKKPAAKKPAVKPGASRTPAKR